MTYITTESGPKQRMERIFRFQIGEQIVSGDESGRVQQPIVRMENTADEYDDGTIYYIDEDRERIGEVTEGERLPEIEFREIYSL